MKKLLFASLLFVCCNVWAQNGQTSRISVFTPNSGKPQAVTSRDSAASVQKSCIKWNYFLLGRGVFLMNYEFLISRNFTGEVGLGLTYRDFIFEALKGVDGQMNSLWQNDGTPQVHLCGEGGIRYYFGGFDGFDGVFVQAGLSYRQYSYPNSPLKSYYGSTVPGYTFFDEQFKFGYQFESRYSDFIYETYIGFAYRNSDWKYYMPDQTSTTYTLQNLNTAYPQFLFGAKIGYAF